MEYGIYRLIFQHSVHFGWTTLESAEMTFQADKLFSALCMEALTVGTDKLSQLIGWAKEGSISFSDAFPYKGKEYFLPKPLLRIGRSQKDDDAKKRKLYKKLEYIPMSDFSSYLKGLYPIEEKDEQCFGRYDMKTSVHLRAGEDTMPYRIGTYSFADDCGLYVIVGVEQAEQKEFLDELMDMLALSGIGGRRSSGLGRFEVYLKNIPEQMLAWLQGAYAKYMTLSVSLPQNQELQEAMEGASYLLLKRSGFVASEKYAPEFRRKRDLYAFKSGSCFLKKFEGQVADVSQASGSHAVYRYLKPMFMGIGQ